MSRQIKFRIWHKSSKTFLTPDSANDYNRVLYRATLIDYFGGLKPEVEIQQSTGLKDRKGAEIYEGDIVLVNKDTPDEFIAIVKYGEGPCDDDFGTIYIGFYLDIPEEIRGPYSASELPFGPYMAENSEIIGNIFESPQLLELK